MAKNKSIDNLINDRKPSRTKKLIAICLLILSIIYLIMPVDFDGNYLGLADDFLFFMAAFSFFASTLMSATNRTAIIKMNLLASTFAILGLAVLLLLAFSPILRVIA